MNSHELTWDVGARHKTDVLLVDGQVHPKHAWSVKINRVHSRVTLVIVELNGKRHQTLDLKDEDQAYYAALGMKRQIEERVTRELSDDDSAHPGDQPI